MNPIDDKYADLGGAQGPLGSPRTEEISTVDNVGLFRIFEGGTIIWHPDFGANAVSDPILERWHWLALRDASRAQIILTDSRSKLITVRGSSQSLYAQSDVIGLTGIFALTRVNDESRPLRHGEFVNLISMHNGNYVIRAGDDRIRAIGSNRGREALFTVIRVSGEGDVLPGDEIALLASNEQFINSKKDGNRVRLWAQSPNMEGATKLKVNFVGGGEAGALGYPIVDQKPSADESGEFCHFSWGSIYSKPTAGVFEVAGHIRRKWNALHSQPNTHLYLKASNGQYLSVAPGEATEVSVKSRDLPGPYETFVLKHPDDGIQALYTFQEGSGQIVHDVSGAGEPLNLILHSLEASEWLPDGGLAITAPNLIDAVGPSTRLIEACKATNELTIAAWIKPTAIAEMGERSPDRIVTLSIDPRERNFTLGQGTTGDPLASYYDVRLRTTSTSPNGMPPLQSEAGTVTETLTYLVYTRNADGVAALYVDGLELVTQQVKGNFSNWAANLQFALANELTLDRPWLGEYHHVAVYNRALSPAEVQYNFHQGVNSQGGGLFLQSLNGRYLAPTERGELAALPGDDTLPDNSLFRFTELADANSPYGVDSIAVQTTKGHYVGIDHDEAGSIRSDRTSIGMAEVFTLEYLGNGDQGVLGYPTSAVERTEDSESVAFEGGAITLRTVDTKLTFFQQNMALLPINWNGDMNAPYEGADGNTQRRQTIEALIDYLVKAQPHIVGLTECFDAEERTVIRRALELKCQPYYALEGPREGTYLDRNAGLLLLSKYPFVESHTTIYRHYPDDASAWENRGALHARIQIPETQQEGATTNTYNIFLANTQLLEIKTDAVADDDEEQAAVPRPHGQLAHLASFIHAYSRPDEPSLLMGDLAIDAHNGRLIDSEMSGVYGFEEVARRLTPVETLWQGAANTQHDITAQDPVNNFAADTAGTERFRNGTRPDYFLLWPGELYEPVFDNAKAVTLQTAVEAPAVARDISDHNGLQAEQVQLRKFAIVVSDKRAPSTITVGLTSLHCLTKTPSIIALDEPFVDMPYLTLQLNEDDNEARTDAVEISRDGGRHTFEAPAQVTTAVVDALKVTVAGWDRNPHVELDTPDAEFPHETIGSSSLEIDDQALRRLLGKSSVRVLPLLKDDSFLQKDGGEYAATVTLTVEYGGDSIQQD